MRLLTVAVTLKSLHTTTKHTMILFAILLTIVLFLPFLLALIPL
jgi:hypothetical protein